MQTDASPSHRNPVGAAIAVLIALLTALGAPAPSYAGDRPDIYTFTPAQRADLYTQMSNYISAAIILEHLNPPGDKHLSSRFVVWHRDYIKKMEDYLISQNKPQFVPLPKWNPATAIPAEFLVAGGVDPDCPVAVFLGHNCNPLANSNPGIALPASLSANLCAQTPFTSFRSTLEVSYHNGVHVAIGGAMGAFKSPAAPIFWLWHAFVDDLWFDWQCVCGHDEGAAFNAYTAAERNTNLDAGVADAWMQDSPADIANEPNVESGAILWESNDIWVRNSPATPVGAARYLNEHQHQNAEYAVIPANRPYIYVKVRNRGCTTISGQLHVYWANASTGLTWPTAFTEVATSPVTLTNITAGREHVGQFHWLDIPVPGGAAGHHFCLIARFVASPPAADPIIGEALNVSVDQNVRNSNQIAWKNLTVVDNFANVFPVLVRNISRNGNLVRLRFDVPPEQREDSYFRHGFVAIDLGQELFTRWIKGGAQGQGIEIDPRGIVRILGDGAFIDRLPIGFDEQFLVNMQFEPGAPPCENATTAFGLRLSAFEGQTLLGGNTYDIRPEAILPAPDVEVVALDPPINCSQGAVRLRIISQIPPDALRQWLRDGVVIPGAIGAGYTATESGHYSARLLYANGCRSTSLPLPVYIDSAPFNDDPCRAVFVPLGQPVEFNNLCATVQAGEVTPGAGSGFDEGCRSEDGWCRSDPDVQNSVWYFFTAPASGAVSIHAGHLDHDAGHDDMVNTQLAVYETPNCDLYDQYRLIAANDDSGNHGIWGTDPALHDLTGLRPGADYYVQIDGYLGQGGIGSLIIEPAAAACPADCDGNGTVNAADVGCFLSLYFNDIANGTTTADCDGNGLTNAADVGCFLNLYFTSLGNCP